MDRKIVIDYLLLLIPPFIGFVINSTFVLEGESDFAINYAYDISVYSVLQIIISKGGQQELFRIKARDLPWSAFIVGVLVLFWFTHYPLLGILVVFGEFFVVKHALSKRIGIVTVYLSLIVMSRLAIRLDEQLVASLISLIGLMLLIQGRKDWNWQYLKHLITLNKRYVFLILHIFVMNAFNLIWTDSHAFFNLTVYTANMTLVGNYFKTLRYDDTVKSEIEYRLLTVYIIASVIVTIFSSSIIGYSFIFALALKYISVQVLLKVYHKGIEWYHLMPSFMSLMFMFLSEDQTIGFISYDMALVIIFYVKDNRRKRLRWI